MDKLCIVVPMWKRFALTNHLLTYYYGMEVVGVEAIIVAVGSKGAVSRRAARGLEYLDVDDESLDAKRDAGVAYCQRYEPDAVCVIGNDDFITQSFWSWAMYQVKTGWDSVGLLDAFVVDIPRRRVLYWGGCTQQELSGEYVSSGRVYSQRFLDAMMWAPFGNQSGDTTSCGDVDNVVRRCTNLGTRRKSINMATIGCQYWSIRTGGGADTMGAFEASHPTVDISDYSWPLFRHETLIEWE